MTDMTKFLPNSTPVSMLYLYKIKSSPPHTNIDSVGCIVAECMVQGIVNVYNLVRLLIGEG